MPSPQYPAVQAARQALADRLREIRLNSGIKTQYLAEAAGWDRWKVGKIEHARRPPTAADIRAWCRVCDAEDQCEDLIAALQSVDSAYATWKRLQRGKGGLRRLQESRLALYEGASTDWTYCSQVVPGLLQTRDYVTELLTLISRRSGGPDDDVPGAAAARIDRQRVLWRPGRKFLFLMEEAALYYRLGEPQVMLNQLSHLANITASAIPSVALGVLPFARARSQWVLENFTVFDGNKVEVEILSALVTITVPGEVSLYLAAFEDLYRSAVFGDEAGRLIEAAADTYR
ncbi:helix-turn-helix domain-containing protein [Actinomadura spongiicola]|uniref:helix-turn-helix domain-containing protein n=1 Tax=Actinomadura spongiicola TaxID=2303421 RepID=UPI0013142A58|nr:helix-turn-helix transcriptional regulator [Actinomadura spongiicola]